MHENNSTNKNESACCDWSEILKTSRQALQPSKLFLAAAGLILTFALGGLLDLTWSSAGWGIDSSELRKSALIVDVGVSQQEESLGVFEVVLQHEKYCLDQALKAARKLELTAGMGDIWWRMHASGERFTPRAGDGYGVVAFVVAMGKGPHWLVTQHWCYGLVFGTLALTIWSLFGGAICRISAMRYARDLRVSFREALGYSKQKFSAFFLAPLIPVVLILIIALCLIVGGWFMRIPAVGSTIGGLIFGLALFGGGLIALIIMGMMGGVSLMWPTLAVEGLDSTDAIGRSFSYLYERMERAVLYAALAVFYGAIVWLVIKLFAFLLALGTYGFVSKAYPELSNMWQGPPQYDQLYAAPDSGDQIEGWVSRNITFPLIKTWLSIAGFLLYGYLVSYYFTGSTIIYFLLRLRVDETEIEDIFVESSAEDIPLPAPAGPAKNQS